MRGAESLDELFWYKIVALVLLLVLSAFFSGSETAYFSLKESRLKALSKKGSKRSKRLLRLLKEPRKLLLTILTGNTIVNVAIASIAALLAIDVAIATGIDRDIAVLIEVIIVTVIVLIFSEVSPKLAAFKHPEKVAEFFSIPLTFFHKLLQPVANILYGMTNFALKTLGIERRRINLGEEELKTLVDMGEEKGTLERDERKMLQGIFELGDTLVREIMVPRTDLTMISIESGIDEAIEIIRKSRYSRIPVYGESVDDIEGILYARDLIPYLDKNGDKIRIADILRPVHYVPETKMVDEMLREFQDKRIKIALIVDEYGGISGLLTLEDILEEIVGEIQDEHDDEEPIFRKTGASSLRADARWDLHDMDEEIGLNFPKGEGYDSLGGFLFHRFGEIPDEGDVVTYKGVEFKVIEVKSNRIMTVEIDTSGMIDDDEEEG